MKKMLKHIAVILLMLVGVQSFTQESGKELYSFGGHAFVEQFPITYCVAQLFSVEDPSTPIAQAQFDTLGYYFFYKVPEGKYFVKAGPAIDDPYFSEYSYTYYPNEIDPFLADTIFLTENNWEYDIDLVLLDPLSPIGGEGEISGTISYDELKEFDLSKVNILLLDSEMNPLCHLQTHEDGSFSFNELINGEYVLFPRVDGYKTEAIHLTIDNNNSSFEDLTISIKNGQISSFIDESLVKMNSFTCFPNPANQSLNLRFEFDGSQQLQTRVLDITGRIIFEETEYSSNNFYRQMNTSDWENGYYFVEVLINGSKAVSQKVAIIH